MALLFIVPFAVHMAYKVPLCILEKGTLTPTLGDRIKKWWGAWVAQSVKRPTLGFSSDHDFMVHEIKPHIGLCTDSAEPAWGSLSLSLSLPPPQFVHMLSLSLSLSK